MNLVTGATGIIGSHVVLELLQTGQEVVACKRKQSDTKKTEKLFSYYSTEYKKLFAKIKWIELDIFDSFSVEEALFGIKNVYHCAGLVSFNNRDKKKLFQINELGTRNIVNACLQEKVETLCHVSSLSVMHNLDFKLPITEEVFWKSSGKESNYAKSKYNAEKEVWRGMEEGLNAVIVNPGIVLSPGFWNQSSSTIFNTCYRGNKFYTSGKSAFVAAADVAKIMIELVEKRQFGNRYILSENNYSFKEVFDKIQTCFDKPVPTIRANMAILKVGWLVDSIISFVSGKSPILTMSVIHSSQNRQTYSNKKINHTLNYRFKAISREIEDICASYLIEMKKN